jgi:3',5'-cyclic AMP phosphodiesterase CpdA
LPASRRPRIKRLLCSTGFEWPTPPVYRLAHISDLHLSRVPPIMWRQLANKRLLGYLSWRVRRHREHLGAILDALVRDLDAVQPDHVAITGDLVNLALPAEFAEARAWLARLGPPESVSLVPGNHDALVRVLPGEGWDHWRAYACSDPGTPDVDHDFPYLRRRGPLAIVGLSTAIPTLPGRATGRLGADQLARLDRLLARLEGDGLCRVLLLHHSPVDGVSGARRRLIDAPELRRCIAEHGADLVLHGHEHAFRFDQIAGTAGPVPVFGMPSASKQAASADEVAQYCVYDIEGSRSQWRIVAASRRFVSASEGFVPGNRRTVARHDDALALVPEAVGEACRKSA